MDLGEILGEKVARWARKRRAEQESGLLTSPNQRVRWAPARCMPRQCHGRADCAVTTLSRNRDALAAAKAPIQEHIACQTVGAWHESGSDVDDTPRSTSSKRSARSGRFKLNRGRSTRLRKVHLPPS